MKKNWAPLSCSLLISEMGLPFILALKHSLLSQGAEPGLFFFFSQRSWTVITGWKGWPVFQEFLLFFPPATYGAFALPSRCTKIYSFVTASEPTNTLTCIIRNMQSSWVSSILFFLPVKIQVIFRKVLGSS